MADWQPFVSAATQGLLGGFNLISQHMTNKYNERMTREQWSREDNAVQRRVKDLYAAGLSPTLAAGSAADSSAPNRADAPQADIDKMNFMSQYYNLVAQKKDLARQDQEIDKLKLQNEALKYANDYMNPRKYEKLIDEMNNLRARSYAAYGSGSNSYAQAALHSRTMSFLKGLEDTFGWFLPGNYQFSNRNLFKGNLDFGILASSLGMDTIKNFFELPYGEVTEVVENALKAAGEKLAPIIEEMKKQEEINAERALNYNSWTN